MSKLHAMVDIETLATSEDAAVIAIGLVPFDRDRVYGEDGVELLISPNHARGRADPATVRWWAGQEQGVFLRMLSGKASEPRTCEAVRAFFSEHEPGTLWANSPSFDITILRSLFERCGRGFPAHFRDERDCRTLFALARELGISYSEAYEDATKHDALSDAIAQARAVQIILQELHAWRAHV